MGYDDRPVAPFVQPEVAADTILFAAEHRRRELWVGGNTTAIIARDKLAPWLGDRYRARTNVQAQQRHDGAHRPHLPDHRFTALDDDGPDRGTHGPFDDDAKGRPLTPRHVFSPTWTGPSRIPARIGGRPRPSSPHAGPAPPSGDPSCPRSPPAWSAAPPPSWSTAACAG
jgi:hypothetical protein